MEQHEIVIIGGGAAGLAAAIASKKYGIEDVLILEREEELGGVLNQCIHTGFGTHIFNEDLTGTEYAMRFIEQINQMNISYKLNTTVIGLTKDKKITAVNEADGIIDIKAKGIIMSVGSREKTKGVKNIRGNKIAGIYSVSSAHRFINFDGYMPGKKVIIFGTDNMALILAKRMLIEGAESIVVIEAKENCSASEENIKSYIKDFNIPLILGYSITKVEGKNRVKGIHIAKLDNNNNVIRQTEKFIECDTLILSVGFMPEIELCSTAGIKLIEAETRPYVDENFQTSISGIFTCGNALYEHYNVDEVTTEGYVAGKNLAQTIRENEFL